MWTRKWTFQNHKRWEFLITQVEKRNHIVQAICYLSRKDLRHSARQSVISLYTGWMTHGSLNVRQWFKSNPKPRHFRCSCTTESQCLGTNHSTTIWKCRIRSVASRYLKTDNLAIYIICGWDVRCHPDWPRGPPSLLYNSYRSFPPGKAATAWCWSPTSFQMPGCKWVTAIPPPPLCAYMGMSWGDLCLYVETRSSLHLRDEFCNEFPSIKFVIWQFLMLQDTQIIERPI